MAELPLHGWAADLRARRHSAGLTQRDLAARAGLSVRAIRDLERGTVRHPHERSVQWLARVLQLPTIDDRSVPNGPAQIGVLGPLVVQRGDGPVHIGSMKLATLLGLLAIQPRRLVTHAEIVDVLWGDNPPPTSSNLVHGYIARLRHLLPPGRPGGPTVVSVRGGYRLDSDAGGLDLVRFLDEASEAGRLQAADNDDLTVEHLARALSVWRGPVLADLGERLRQHPAAVAAAQQRLGTALAWADLATDAGQGRLVAESLRALARDEPLHEGLHTRLMVALASSGELAAALRLYAELRTRLATELGVEPGPQLQAAHLRILRRQIPAADVVASPERTGRPRPPQQLPLDVPGFTGRGEHLAQLDGMLPDGPQHPAAVIVASVSGAAGVGKTALVVHWAHRVRARFADGVLFADLRGYDPVAAPMAPGELLDGFLRMLGVPPESIPVRLAERAALFRSQLDGLQMLIVLDNAATSEQVRWLLPGSPGCLVMVTSRSRLSGLVARHGAYRVPVDVLPRAEALDLLRHVLGRRVDAEPDEAARLARLCGGLPLALRLAAERANTHPHRTLADLRQALSDEYERLDLLAADDDTATAVRSVLVVVPGPAGRGGPHVPPAQPASRS